MRMFRICYCKKICLFFVLPKFKFAILEKCSFLADLFAKKKIRRKFLQIFIQICTKYLCIFIQKNNPQKMAREFFVNIYS